MRTWIVTDTHFNHQMLIDIDVREPDFEEEIKENLKKNVRPEDLLIHLGDICIGKDDENARWFKENLGCKLMLTRGNHDHKSYDWYMERGWDMVVEKFTINKFGKRICFSHRPTEWDGSFDINIHGHFHLCQHRNEKTTHRHHLMSMELQNNQPVLLKTYIEKLTNCKKYDIKLER